MRIPPNIRPYLVASALAVICATAAVAAAGCGAAATTGTQPSAGAPQISLTIDPRRDGQAIPRGFLGLGFEYRALANAAGTNPDAVDPVLEQLIENLSPGQSPILRIGGDTTDWSWWPISGVSRPPGLHYDITPTWVAVTHALTRGLGARLILGINLEADSPQIASVEAQQMVSGLGSSSVMAFELGNEPELYHSFGWYRAPDGREVPGRPANYNFSMYEREFSSLSAGLPRVPVAGPTTGGPWWEPDWPQFLQSEPQVKLATVHRYPLHACSKRSSPIYPTVDNLLSPQASAGLAASTLPLMRLAHAHGIPLRIDEMNPTPCPTRARQLRSFAGALWAADVLFQLAADGVDGVNVQSSTGYINDLFAFQQHGSTWEAAVEPEYYGLLLFAQATPPGSRLISVSPAPRAPLRVWATTDPPNAGVRVVLINEGASARVVGLHVPGAKGPATLERLSAPSVTAQQGIALGGQTFGSETTTGRLSGQRSIDRVVPRGDRYVVSLPARSAALLSDR